jgi:ADP-ribose pyrophosphatase YjhB (NUDIX family)
LVMSRGGNAHLLRASGHFGPTEGWFCVEFIQRTVGQGSNSRQVVSCRTPALIQLAGSVTLVGMAEFVRRVPEDDNRERLVCADCGFVSYENPKVIVGSVVVADGRVLLCKRAIEPRMGFWTLPAGYLELGETLQEGAMREALEEAEAAIELDGILGVFSIARIGQVQVIFRARFADDGPPRFAAGPESLAVDLFASDEIPWNDIAFPSVRWALDAWQRSGAGALGVPAGNPPDDPRGVHYGTPAAATPSDSEAGP